MALYISNVSSVFSSYNHYSIRVTVSGITDETSFELKYVCSGGYSSTYIYNDIMGENVTVYFNYFPGSLKQTWYVRNIGGSWSNPVSITTPDINESEFLPSYSPTVTHQYVYRWEINQGGAGSCVANSLATIKEIQEYREGKGSYNPYSIGWIFGNRSYSGDFLYYVDSLNTLMSDGTPRYEYIPENRNNGVTEYPDIYFESSAKTMVNNNKSTLLSYAQTQRISSYSTFPDWWWDVPGIQNHIKDYGFAWLTFDLPNNFYDAIDNGGIVPDSNNTIADGHSIVVLGWKKINGISYWICHNSWGTDSGDDGRFYIPFYYNTGQTWYKIFDSSYSEPLPSTVSAPILGEPPRIEGGFNIQWNHGIGAFNYQVKFRKDSDGSIIYSNALKTYNYPNNYLEENQLQFGTKYWLSVRGGNTNWGNWSTENPATTLPKTPVINVYEVTETSIQISCFNMEDNWNHVEVRRYNSNGVKLDSKYIYNGGNGTVTWSNLPQNTSYQFKAISYLLIDDIGWPSYNFSNIIYVTTLGAQRPTNWNGFTNISFNQPITNLTYTEWNNFLDKINEFEIYFYPDHHYTDFTGFRPTINNKTFSASMFNKARYAVGSMASTGIQDKNPGDPVLASYFQTLKEKLNGIP